MAEDEGTQDEGTQSEAPADTEVPSAQPPETVDVDADVDQPAAPADAPASDDES